MLTILINNQEIIINDTLALDLDDNLFSELGKMVDKEAVVLLETLDSRQVLICDGFIISHNPFDKLQVSIGLLMDALDCSCDVIDLRDEGDDYIC